MTELKYPRGVRRGDGNVRDLDRLKRPAGSPVGYLDEWQCPHGIGHPYHGRPHHGGGIHGCDGCCASMEGTTRASPNTSGVSGPEPSSSRLAWSNRAETAASPEAYHRCSPERTAALEALEAAVEAFHDSGDPDAFYAEVARTLSASTRTRP